MDNPEGSENPASHNMVAIHCLLLSGEKNRTYLRDGAHRYRPQIIVSLRLLNTINENFHQVHSKSHPIVSLSCN
jgi:hypothetical protein